MISSIQESHTSKQYLCLPCRLKRQTENTERNSKAPKLGMFPERKLASHSAKAPCSPARSSKKYSPVSQGWQRSEPSQSQRFGNWIFQNGRDFRQKVLTTFDNPDSVWCSHRFPLCGSMNFCQFSPCIKLARPNHSCKYKQFEHVLAILAASFFAMQTCVQAASASMWYLSV